MKTENDYRYEEQERQREKETQDAERLVKQKEVIEDYMRLTALGDTEEL